ncbi:MAG: hypothetical protein P1Q69_16150 [Candidatus Thorarchaeota archaeon]|nr:hypothetical protein [Candidatus Thorarchaeota archaeon]
MDRLLIRAKGLYADRQRIALATLSIVFTVTFYVFYSPGIYIITEGIVTAAPYGSVQGFEIVYSFNTIGFYLAFSILVFAYAFWSWAFLPTPAVSYTMGVLRGIFGSKTRISHSFGKRFKVLLSDELWVQITCKIKGHGPEEWFLYRLESSTISNPNLENVALRHGMSVSENKLVTWVSNEELHSRTMLMSQAIASSAT